MTYHVSDLLVEMFPKSKKIKTTHAIKPIPKVNEDVIKVNPEIVKAGVSIPDDKQLYEIPKDVDVKDNMEFYKKFIPKRNSKIQVKSGIEMKKLNVEKQPTYHSNIDKTIDKFYVNVDGKKEELADSKIHNFLDKLYGIKKIDLMKGNRPDLLKAYESIPAPEKMKINALNNNGELNEGINPVGSYLNQLSGGEIEAEGGRNNIIGEVERNYDNTINKVSNEKSNLEKDKSVFSKLLGSKPKNIKEAITKQSDMKSLKNRMEDINNQIQTKDNLIDNIKADKHIKVKRIKGTNTMERRMSIDRIEPLIVNKVKQKRQDKEIKNVMNDIIDKIEDTNSKDNHIKSEVMKALKDNKKRAELKRQDIKQELNDELKEKLKLRKGKINKKAKAGNEKSDKMIGGDVGDLEAKNLGRYSEIKVNPDTQGTEGYTQNVKDEKYEFNNPLDEPEFKKEDKEKMIDNRLDLFEKNKKARNDTIYDEETVKEYAKTFNLPNISKIPKITNSDGKVGVKKGDLYLYINKYYKK